MCIEIFVRGNNKMSTHNKTINNIRIKNNKASLGLVKEAPTTIVAKQSNALNRIESAMENIGEFVTKSFYAGSSNWDARHFFSNKQKWEDFLKASLVEHNIFNKREAKELMFKYDERPKIFMPYDGSYSKDISFRVWRKSARKETMYDIKAELNAYHETSRPAGQYITNVTVELDYKEAEKTTIEKLKEERKNPPIKNIPIEKQVFPETLQKIEELEKHFAANKGPIPIDAVPPKDAYNAHQSLNVFFSWLKKEVFTNDAAQIKVMVSAYGSYMNTHDTSTTMKYIIWQTHQKRKTGREYEITFTADPTIKENQSKQGHYKKGTFAITGIKTLP